MGDRVSWFEYLVFLIKRPFQDFNYFWCPRFFAQAMGVAQGSSSSSSIGAPRCKSRVTMSGRLLRLAQASGV